MLEGKRVRLRPIKRADIDLFLKWFNDPEVTRNLIMYLPMTETAEEKWIDDAMKAQRPVFVIEGMRDGGWKPIGNCGFHDIKEKDKVATFGIAIGEKSFWGNGYGTEAAKLIIDYGFKFLNLHKIESEAFAFNEKSIRMHKKLGFVVEGCRRQRTYKEGKYHANILFGLLWEEWEAIKK